MEARDRRDLATLLRKEGFILISASQEGIAQKKGAFHISLFEGFGGVPINEKIVFTRNLRLLLKAGVNIGIALETLASQSLRIKFQRALFDVKERVVRGEMLSQAFQSHPDVFPEFYVSMIRVGEESGTLEDSLQIITFQMERDWELRTRVRGAMIYPTVIIIVMVLVSILMMTLVVPRLASIFTELKLELPMTTRILILISNFMQRFWFFVPGIFILLIFLFRIVHRSHIGRALIDRAFLRFPILGGIVRKINIAQTAQTLSSLITSGVPIVRSIEITAATLGNVHFRTVLGGAGEYVRKGGTLHEYFSQWPFFYPPLIVQMVKVGEETGNLSEILKEIANFYYEEINTITRNLTSVIEPLLMVIIGAGVGFFAVSMIQPMYAMLGGI